MTRKSKWERGGAAIAIVLVALAACGAALPENAAPTGGQESAAASDAGVQPSDAGDAGPKCPYGALEDAHRGFVRCLEPGEADGGAPSAEAPPSDAGAAPPGPPPSVEVGTPTFDNGDVPHIDKALRGARGDVAKCVAEHGGLSGASGNVKLQFLVRSRGRAEGVEVTGSKNVTPEATACIRVALKNRAVGAPSADPVGVTVTFSLKAAPSSK